MQNINDILTAEPIPTAGRIDTADVCLEWDTDGRLLEGPRLDELFDSLQVSASPASARPCIYVELAGADGERVRLEAEVPSHDALRGLPPLQTPGEPVPLGSLLALISTLRALDVPFRHAPAASALEPERRPPEAVAGGRCVLEPVNVDGRWGFRHPDEPDGLQIDARYDRARAFSERRAAIMRDGMWGFVNPDGTEVIEPAYQTVRDFDGGYAVVATARSGGRSRWGLIDELGDIVVEPRFRDAKEPSDGMMAVRDIGGWGYVDIETDELTIPPTFEDAGPFDEYGAMVETRKGRTQIDRKGNPIGEVDRSKTDWFSIALLLVMAALLGLLFDFVLGDTWVDVIW